MPTAQVLEACENNEDAVTYIAAAPACDIFAAAAVGDEEQQLCSREEEEGDEEHSFFDDYEERLGTFLDALDYHGCRLLDELAIVRVCWDSFLLHH